MPSPFPEQDTPSPNIHSPLRWMPALALLYAIGMEISLLFKIEPISISPFWIPNTVILWAMLHTPRRHWGLCLAAILPGSLLVGFRSGIPLSQELLFICVNSLEILIATMLIRAWLGARFQFAGLQTFFLYLAAVLIATALASALGAALILGRNPLLLRVWATWWLGDLLGILIVGTPLLAGRPARDLESPPFRRLEFGGILALTTLLAGGFFLLELPQVHTVPFPLYLLMIPLVWAGIRLPLQLACVVVGSLALLSMVGTMLGVGPFSPLELSYRMLLLQGFLTMSAVVTALLGAAMRDIHLAHAQERRMRRLFQTTLDNLPIGLSVSFIDNGKVLYHNTRFAEICEWPHEELDSVDEFFEKVFPDTEQREKLRRQIQEDLDSGDPTRMAWENVEVTGKQGRKRVISAKSIPVSAQNLMINTLVDTTERHRAEKALEVALVKYRTLFESFPLGIIVTDPEGSILESNTASESILDISREELKQRGIGGEDWNILRPDGSLMPPEKFATVRALRENRLLRNVEAGLVKPGGHITWVNLNTSPLKLEGYGVVLTFNDITERVMTEHSLQRSRQDLNRTRRLLDKTFDGISDVILLVRLSERTIEMSNASIRRIFGYTPKEVTGRSTELLYVDREHFEQFGHMALDSLKEAGSFHAEFEMRRKDGTVFPTEHTVTLIRSEEGGWRHVVSVIRDITNRKQREQELQAYQERLLHSEKFAAIGRVSSGIAHEINNPLASIRSSTELMMRELSRKPGPEHETQQELHRRAEKVLRNVDRCKRIVENLLGVAREGLGDPRPMDLIDSLNEALSDVRECGAGTHAPITCTSARITLNDIAAWQRQPPDPNNLPPLQDSGLFLVLSRPGQISQVLRNLLENALAATPTGGRVFLSCQRSESGYELCVADTGEGIPSEDIPLLFEPFYTTRAHSEGTGLGLYMAQRIVEKSGGQLTCESIRGIGTLMRFTLPHSRMISTTPQPDLK